MAKKPDTGEMSRQAFEVAYAGSPDDHSMDVQDLAPALLAVGRLVREANSVINGKKATVKVFVVSDFEHKCFNINFEVVQLYEHLKSLVTDDNVQSAKNILEWVGILVGTPATAGLGLWQFLRWKRGRPVANTTEIQEATKSGMISVKVQGDDNPVVIHQNVYVLSQNSKVLNAVRDTLTPLQADNLDRIEFRKNGKIVAETSEAEAKDIVASTFDTEVLLIESAEVIPDTVTAYLKVYSPVFDPTAKNWRFIYGESHIYADVSETTIAKDSIRRGGAMIDDIYKVRMEITQSIAEGNKVTNHYRIKDVLDFIPAPQQGNLNLSGPEPA